MGLGGNDRAQVPDAPDGLALVQDLLNTTAWPVDAPPRLPDLLADIALAQPWVDRVVASLGDAPVALVAADLDRLREVRGGLRRALAARQGFSTAAVPPVAETVQVALGADGRIDIEPGGGPAAAVRGAVLAAAWHAQSCGDLDRLKLCAHPGCRLAFYDTTRNRSGRFHSPACANRVHLANSRNRRVSD